MKSNCGEQSSHVYANQSSPINQGVHNQPQGFSHTFSNIMSNVGSARAISIPISLPTSDQRISSTQNFKESGAQNSNNYNVFVDRENLYQKVFDIQQKNDNYNISENQNYVNDFKITDSYNDQAQNHNQIKSGSLNQKPLNNFQYADINSQEQNKIQNENIPLQLSNQDTEASRLNSNQKGNNTGYGQRSNSLSSGTVGLTQTLTSPFNNQQGPSALVRQLSDKISIQAERLQVMEAYKALCERRILDFDPNHQLPIMPYHLGTNINIQDDNSQTNTNADFKRLLALKEQDLLYSYQRNEKLIREIEELKNSNKNVGNQGNFEALRKEIELNEKLQRQVEMQQEQIQKLQNQENLNQKSVSPQRSVKSQRSDNENGNVNQQLKKLKEQLESLNEEKNALLDYIEENIDKSIVNKDLNQFSEELKQIKNLNQTLQSQNQDLKQRLDTLSKINQQYQIQLDQVSKNNSYSNIMFGAQNIMNDQLKQNNNIAENTFGLDQINNMIEKKVDNENIKIEKDELIEKYSKIKDENEQLKERIRGILHMENQDGNVSSRTQRSGTDRLSERGYTSSSKQIIRELEIKLKATQENSKTLSLTLNETQAELDQLTRDHQQINKDFKNQLEENSKLYQHLQNNQKYLESLKQELFDLEIQKQKNMDLVSKQEEEIKQSQEQKSKDKERIERLENHIRELKVEQQKNVNSASEKWEETINELTKDLQSTKEQVQKRQEMFSQMENEYKNKISYYEKGGKYEKNNLEKRVEDLKQEVKQLQQIKYEKDQKLKNQIRKNEELLGELQELSEAVNLLKNDRELTLRSEVIVQKQNIIEEYSNFISNIQKKSFDKIFSSLLKFTDYIREFYKSYKLQPFELEQQFLENKINKQQNQNKDEDLNQVFPLLIFDQIDRNLKSVADMQIEWQKNQYGVVKNSESENEMCVTIKVEKDLKIMNNLLKDLEQLSSNLLRWNQGVIENYKIKIQQLNESQKNLESYQNETVNLKDQLKRINQEETQIVERDKQLENELRQLNMTLVQKEKQMEDQYKREDKLGRQNQKLKVQLDNLIKEYGNISKNVHKLIKEKDEYEKLNQDQNIQIIRLSEQIGSVEYQLNGMNEQVSQVNSMIDILSKAMPSQQLSSLLIQMQNHIQLTYQLNQKFMFTETNLLQMENQFKILAQSDTSISQNVIQLRKNIDQSRREIKTLQLQKIELQSEYRDIVNNLRSIEQIEKRRNDVGLETEKSLADAKQQIQELKREIMLTNNSRRDLELTIFSIKQQSEIYERELMQLRIQVSQNQVENKTATLGNALAKMRTSKSLSTFSQDSGQKAVQRSKINNYNPLQGIIIEDTPTGQNSSQKHSQNPIVNHFNFDQQQLQNQYIQRAQSHSYFNPIPIQKEQYTEQILNNNMNYQENNQYSFNHQNEQNQRQEQLEQIYYPENEYKQSEIYKQGIKEREEQSSRQNEYTFSPLRQRSMSAGLNRPIVTNYIPHQQITQNNKIQAASTSNLQKTHSFSIYKTQNLRYQPEQLHQNNLIDYNELDNQGKINSEHIQSDKKLHSQGVLQMENNQQAKLPPFHPKASQQFTKNSLYNKSENQHKRIQIGKNYQQNDVNHILRPQSLIENLNYIQNDMKDEQVNQMNKIQRSQSAYQQDYGTFGDQLQNEELYKLNKDNLKEEYQRLRMEQNKIANEKQQSQSSNIIMNYPSMQNIHTSQSNNNEFQTVDENSNNLFSFPASTNSNHNNQPIFIQNETSRDDNYDFQVDVNLKHFNNKYANNYNQKNMLITPSLTTNKTELAKQGLQIEHAKLSESKQSGTIQSQNHEQHLFEKQKDNNMNKMEFSNIHKKINSFDSEQIDGVGLSDFENNNVQSNDFVIGYDNEKDNSLIQSNCDQSDSSFKDQENSQNDKYDEYAFKKSDLQKKLSQVKNVFSSIRQNLNEASTVQDPASSSQD